MAKKEEGLKGEKLKKLNNLAHQERESNSKGQALLCRVYAQGASMEANRKSVFQPGLFAAVRGKVGKA